MTEVMLLKGFYEDFVQRVINRIQKSKNKVNIVIGKSGNGLSVIARLIERRLKRKNEDVIFLDMLLEDQNIAERKIDRGRIVIIDNVHSVLDLKKIISKVEDYKTIIMYSGGDLDEIRKNFSRNIVAELFLSKDDLRKAARQLSRKICSSVSDIKKRKKMFMVLVNIFSYNIEIGAIDTIRALVNFTKKVQGLVLVDDLEESRKLSKTICAIFDILKHKVISLASENIEILIRRVGAEGNFIIVEIEKLGEWIKIPIISRRESLRADQKHIMFIVRYKLGLSNSILDSLDLMKYHFRRRSIKIFYPLPSENRKVLENIKIQSIAKILKIMCRLMESAVNFLKAVCLLCVSRKTQKNIILEISIIFAYVLCLFSWARFSAEYLDKIIDFFTEVLSEATGSKENKALMRIAESIIGRLIRERKIRTDKKLMVDSPIEDLIESIYREIKFRIEMIS